MHERGRRQDVLLPAAQCEAGSLTHSSSLGGEAKGGLTPAQGANNDVEKLCGVQV